MSSPNSTSTLLRRALQGNAVFSTVSGILFIAAAKPVGAFLGPVPPWLMVATGVSLLLFAARLVHNSVRSMVSVTEAKAAVVMDMVWVVGSGLAVVFANGLGLSRPGTWAIVIVADVVLVFAVLQFLGVRRVSRVQAG